MTDTLRLRLPATSANLGSGFDTAALALSFGLEVDATEAREFSLRATGRNADICGSLDNNLLLETYRGTLNANQMPEVPLAIEMRNEIPLGMGCGSSAAVRLAGVALAAHFGRLAWDRDRILTEASLLEGHPDNTAACWLGGLAVASCEGGRVYAASIQPSAQWSVLLAMPHRPLATTAARAVLPQRYDRSDVVANLQRVALLTAAFALGRGDLLRVAMQDRIHQPYRGEICPLLPLLLPLAGMEGILGVALSGAGPAVLLLVESPDALPGARRLVLEHTEKHPGIELLESAIETNPARYLGALACL
jgi:homoserine kinase